MRTSLFEICHIYQIEANAWAKLETAISAIHHYTSFLKRSFATRSPKGGKERKYQIGGVRSREQQKIYTHISERFFLV